MTARTPEATRHRILEAAFLEFYRHGFQGGNLNDIIAAAQATKGALFHHFAGKQALGLAVVDDVIGPILSARWLAPLQDARDPLSVLKRTFRRYVKEDIASGNHVHGCPLNNIAQEMSPLDPDFRTRIDALYESWRATIAEALTRGIEAGNVRPDAVPQHVAALVVAAQMGIWGTGKASQDPDRMKQASEALCHYLDTLKP